MIFYYLLRIKFPIFIYQYLINVSEKSTLFLLSLESIIGIYNIQEKLAKERNIRVFNILSRAPVIRHCQAVGQQKHGQEHCQHCQATVPLTVGHSLSSQQYYNVCWLHKIILHCLHRKADSSLFCSLTKSQLSKTTMVVIFLILFQIIVSSVRATNDET